MLTYIVTMQAEIKGTPKGSLVHRFITCGKPGTCTFCGKWVSKLEAHHVSYRPEITIKLCHEDHHKTHFWPLRLTTKEKFLLFKLIKPEKEARRLSEKVKFTVEGLSRMIAPSRSRYVQKQQALNYIQSQHIGSKTGVVKSSLKQRKVIKVKLNSIGHVCVPHGRNFGK